MNILKRLRGHFSHQAKALLLYKQGMAKAKQHDHQGAIDDYTAAISMAGAPAQMKAMVLYNRALVYSAIGKTPKATEDLNLILVMKGALNSVRTESKRMLWRMQPRSERDNS
ncbi:MAG: hypothetical protein RIC12_00900 [Pirellulales bacterium]